MAVVAATEFVLMAQPHGTASSHQTFSKSRAQSSPTASCTQEAGRSETRLGVFRGGGALNGLMTPLPVRSHVPGLCWRVGAPGAEVGVGDSFRPAAGNGGKDLGSSQLPTASCALWS